MSERQSAKTLTKSVLSNWAGLSINALVMLLITPFVLHSLGPVKFGIWALVTTFTGYYGLLDIGFSASLTYFFSRHLAVGDYKSLNRDASIGFSVLTTCGIALIGVSSLLALFSPRLFDSGLDDVTEMQWCFFILGCSVASSFFFFVYSAVFLSKQRFDLANLVTGSVRIVYAIGVLAILSNGFGLVGLAAWMAATNLGGGLLRARIAHRILPQLSISFGFSDMKHLLRLATFGGWSFVVTASRTVIHQTDVIVIALFLGSAPITPFYLAARIAHQFSHVFAAVGSVFFPFFAQLAATKSETRMRRVYQRGTRLVSALAITVGAVALFWNEPFFSLWIGEELPDLRLASPAALFAVLLTSTVVVLTQLIGYQLFFAKERLRLLAALVGTEAVVNLGLSIVLVQRLGLMGVALGTLIPAVIVRGVIQPLVVGRLIDLPFSVFLRNVWLRLFVLLVIVGGLMRLAPSFEVTNWWALGAGGVISFLVVGAVAAAVCFDKDDMEQFVLRPIEAVATRFSGRGRAS